MEYEEIKKAKSSDIQTSGFRPQRGVSIYLSIVILGLILAIALGMSTILLSQMKLIREIGDSVVSFYGADSGIERAIYEGKSVSGSLPNGASYSVEFISPGPECPGQSYCLRSFGVYKKTRRAIEVIR